MRAMVLGVALLLAGCATPEYEAQLSICELIWGANLPPKYEQVVRQGYRYIEVPDGRSVCVAKTLENGDVRTVCEEDTRLVSIPYTYLETIDRNEYAREEQTEICVHNACLKRYGDPFCRPSGG